jgi:hypothetical protein
MAMKLEGAGRIAWVAGPLVALALAFGWLRVIEDGTSQRAWRSWKALNAAADAVAAMQQATGKLPAAGSFEDVARQLEPTHARDLPRVDGWGRPLEYVTDGATWELASRGAFGEPGPVSLGPVRAYADDLVLASGGIMSWPESPCGALDEARIEELRTAPPDGERDLLPAPEGAVDKRREPKR